ncbi:MAG TPA: Rrf2 family transcriptional regulator [Elusimicrobia bacterium]|nr:Rrf2 family transcriptional regulator [Elusimicrobiota bacterium]HBT61567.1 Rrf2 family transcriptional regulator [Elusimicrobiota bacterium]
MSGILNISEGSVIALHAALLLAKDPGQAITTNEAARTLDVSAAHLSKVFQRLAKSGIVKAVRGPKGGYRLGKGLSEIRLRDIFEAIEGPMQLSRCLLSQPRCGLRSCILGSLLESINEQVARQFEKRLSQLSFRGN